MNIPLLQQVRDAILAEPTKFDMSGWFQRDVESPCGTTACIAGHGFAILYQTETLTKADELYNRECIIILLHMTNKFDLTSIQAANLFFDENWPDQFRYAYQYATQDDDRTKMAKIAADRIDYLIATGE